MMLMFKITACLAFAAMYLYYMHMFQQNSYKMLVQCKWYAKNIANVAIRGMFAVIGAIFLFLPQNFLMGAVISNILCLIVNLPRKAKKPLVFTTRVKRMIVSAVIMVGIIFALESFLYTENEKSSLLVSFTLILAPLFVLITNIINKPVELCVKNYYINDAKKIIASMPNLIVIGITGSYGKTSTKFFLEKILSSKYNVLMTPESYNTTMGVVKTIRESLKPTHEIFICEMGAKGIGHIKEICDIVKPKFGIITSIGPQHLESFKTIENIITAKFELCDALPNDGVIFLNGDNEYIRNNKINKKAVYYGLENNGKKRFLRGKYFRFGKRHWLYRCIQ